MTAVVKLNALAEQGRAGLHSGIYGLPAPFAANQLSSPKPVLRGRPRILPPGAAHHQDASRGCPTWAIRMGVFCDWDPRATSLPSGPPEGQEVREGMRPYGVFSNVLYLLFAFAQAVTSYCRGLPLLSLRFSDLHPPSHR